MKDANYKGFIDSAKRVSKVNKKPWMVNLADCLFCTAKYGSGYIDYETFEMFNLGAKDRENILTISKNNAIFKKLNNLDYFAGVKVAQQGLYHTLRSKKPDEVKALKISAREMIAITRLIENGESILYFVTGKKSATGKNGVNDRYKISYNNGVFLDKYYAMEKSMNASALDYVESNELYPVSGSKLKLDLEVMKEYNYIYRHDIQVECY